MKHCRPGDPATIQALLIVPLLVLLALPAQADIYKCKLPNGGTEISNSPCPSGSGTLTARPDETVPAESRQQAERDVARMRDFVTQREAEQRREEAAERQLQAEDRQRAATQRVYQTPSMEECLRELGQQTLDSKRRSELESICRAKARQEPTQVVVPVHGGVVYSPDACIRNVQRQHLHPAEQERRIAACRGVVVPPPDRPQGAPTRPAPRPLKPCPRDDRYCVR